MGIFCMVFGVAVFGGFVAFGALLPTFEATFYTGGPLVTMFNMTTEPLPYMLVFGFIGLLIGLSFFMQGLTYQKVSKIARRRRERDR